jgi:predicted DNA-binding transcriptional regulator AlpA
MGSDGVVGVAPGVTGKRRGRYRSAADILNLLPPELAGKRVLPSVPAAEFLGISHDELKHRRSEGRMPPAVRLGDRLLGYTVESLIALIESRTETP